MAISLAYEYKVSCIYINGNKSEEILPESITNIIINCDYDTRTTPTIYVGIKINSALYDKMVATQESARIILKISKSNKNSSSSIFKDYINEEFTYSMTTDADYYDKLEKAADTSNKIGVNYKAGYLSLLRLDNIDNNKHFVNTIIKNSNMSSIIHKFTSHMTIIMEPLHVDKLFSHLVIPPIETVSKLLRYLNSESVFYRGGYRYFIDFDRAYLLSEEGNYVNDYTGTFGNVIINIQEPTNDLSQQTGIVTDGDNNTFIINVSAANTQMNIKKTEDKIFNTIIGIDSYGNKKELSLDIPRTVGSNDKPRLEKIQSDNLDFIDCMKSKIENSSIVLNITKTEMDPSVITPNKTYTISNYEKFREYDGKFILSTRKEILVNQNGIFTGSLLMGLRKVKGVQ